MEQDEHTQQYTQTQRNHQHKAYNTELCCSVLEKETQYNSELDYYHICYTLLFLYETLLQVCQIGIIMFKGCLSNDENILMLYPFLLGLKLAVRGPSKHSHSSLFDSQHGTRTPCFLFSQSNIDRLNWHNLFLPLYCRLCFILLYLFVPRKEYSFWTFWYNL